MPKVTITTAGGVFEVENDTVANVADLLREVADTFNISPDANVDVNGRPATGDTPLVDGDEIATTKAAGAKGY